jgi:hypothetical protein
MCRLTFIIYAIDIGEKRFILKRVMGESIEELL